MFPQVFVLQFFCSLLFCITNDVPVVDEMGFAMHIPVLQSFKKMQDEWFSLRFVKFQVHYCMNTTKV